jgi:YHS domain-containing protein
MIWRLVLILIILTVIRSLLVRFFYPAGQKQRVTQRRSEQRVSGRMVKDPQCGMYVSADLAIPGRSPDKTVYFCSPECRDQYAKAALQKTKG